MRHIGLKTWSFFFLILISLCVIGYSTIQYLETYATITNLTVSIADVNFLNGTSSSSSIVLTFTLINPSSFLDVTLKSFTVRTYLNGEELQYLPKNHYYDRAILPTEDFQITINYLEFEAGDVSIIEAAKGQNMWEWSFQLNVHIEVVFKEAFLDFSKTHTGVKFSS